MSTLTLIAVCATMLATNFLSGLFGMAGGVILIGLLLVLLPVQQAMVLHGITQLTSNIWRVIVWRSYIRWDIALIYSIGSLLALGLWSITRYVPDKAVAFLLLGVTPFLTMVMPKDMRPDAESKPQAIGYGIGCTTLILLTGVAGPMLDTFFLGGKLERRQIIATKSVCQVLGHSVKLVYFAGIVIDPGTIDYVTAGLAIVMAAIGTAAAKPVVERLSEKVYRLWANRIVVTVSVYYSCYGVWLLAEPLLG